MRDEKGRFIKGHYVPTDWIESHRSKVTGVPNPKNKYKRTEKQLNNLRTIGIGRVPLNKGLGSKEFNCIVCGKTVLDKPYRRKRFCSKECRDMYSHIMRGETHWNYTGENNKAQRNWSEYRDWHKSVLCRDGYKCYVCGKIGGRLQAHHVKSFAKYPELRFDISNGVTVCRECHLIELHRWKLSNKKTA